MIDLKQASCPSLMNFIEKFKVLEAQSTLDASAKRDLLLGGLKPEIKAGLLSNIPKTVIELISVVMEIDSNLSLVKVEVQNGFKSYNSFTQGVARGSNNTEVYCKYHKSHGHSSRDCKDKVRHAGNQANFSKKWCSFHESASHNTSECRNCTRDSDDYSGESSHTDDDECNRRGVKNNHSRSNRRYNSDPGSISHVSEASRNGEKHNSNRNENNNIASP